MKMIFFLAAKHLVVPVTVFSPLCNSHSESAHANPPTQEQQPSLSSCHGDYVHIRAIKRSVMSINYKLCNTPFWQSYALLLWSPTWKSSQAGHWCKRSEPSYLHMNFLGGTQCASVSWALAMCDERPATERMTEGRGLGDSWGMSAWVSLCHGFQR